MPVSKSIELKELVPYWKSDCGRVVIYVGDCCKVMAQMKPNQFHAIVSDPPYGLEFMGEEWDAPWKKNGSVDARQSRNSEMTEENKRRYIAASVTYGTNDKRGFQTWFLTIAQEMLQVVKPGAYILCFGGTRMWHRMTCAIEDAGFEVRDCRMWCYSSGFPKGTNVSKDIDKMYGLAKERGYIETTGHMHELNKQMVYKGQQLSDNPVSQDAKNWDGWNTQLKPAYEPVILARKDLAATVAENVLEHGCGAINIDNCRVGTDLIPNGGNGNSSGSGIYKFNKPGATRIGAVSKKVEGRWPANFIHDGSEDVVNQFPELKSTLAVMELPLTPGDCIGEKHGGSGIYKEGGYNDSGNVSRIFYTVKAGADDRPHGKGAVNHPTVKPLDLMQYLCRLICVRGGTVLDPFMGSGSTGCAAIIEGMRFVGIEQNVEYADIAIGRLKLALSENLSIGTVPERMKQPKVTNTQLPVRRLRS